MVNMSITGTTMGGNETETWYDRKPTHRPVPKAVRDALAYANKCIKEFNYRLNEIINKGLPNMGWDEIELLELLSNRVKDAEKALGEARDAALNDCTCSHDPNREDATCPVCINANRQAGIPFEGSGL